MSVILKGWFGENNIGDDLILFSSIEVIKTNYTTEDIFISSNHPTKDKNRWIYDHDFTLKSWIKLIIRGNIFENIIVTLKAHTIFFSIGGGFSDWNPIVLKRLMRKVKYYKFLNKKVIFLGVGAGPFVGNFDNLQIQSVFNQVDHILVRDKSSKRMLEEVGINNVTLTNDIVFENTQLSVLKTNNYQKSKMVTIIPTPLFYNALWKDNVNNYNKYLKSLADTIDYLSMNYEVKILPFQVDLDNKYLINDLKKLTSNVDVIEYKKYEEAYEVMNKSEFIVPMRFHGMVLSAIFEIPMIPIIYDHKLADLAEAININKYCLNVGDGVNWKNEVFTLKEFKEKHEMLIENYNDIKKSYRKNIPEFKKNGEFLKENDKN